MSRGVNVGIVYGNGETVSFGKCRFQHNSEKSVLSLLNLRKFDDGDGGGEGIWSCECEICGRYYLLG